MTFDAAWYATVIDAVPEGIIVCDATGRAVLANQRALDLLGMSLAQVRREEPVDPTWQALHLDGTVRASDDLPVDRALRTGRPVHLDRHGIRREDGSVVWVTANVEHVPDPAPDLAVVATFRDTTELSIGHNVDQALLRTAARLVERPVADTAVIDDHLSDLAMMCGADRAFYATIEHDAGRARVTHDWSRVVDDHLRAGTGVALDLIPRLLGRLARREIVVVDEGAEDRIVGQLLAMWGLESALVAPVHSTEALASMVIVGWARPGSPDQRIVDGMAVAAELLAARLELDKVHRDLQVLNTTLDDRVRERSAELLDEKDRIAALLGAIPDLMFEIDADGNFVDVHAPDESLLIMAPSEFIGRSSAEVMHDAINQDLSRMVSDGLRTNPTEVDVVEYTTDIYEGGTRSFECRIVHRATGGVLVVVRDITGQAERANLLREHSDRLARANEDLERAVRAKDDFLAGVGHELRTPLSAILGLTEILLDDEVLPLPPPQQATVETIRASGAHLLSLINDLLDLDQIDNRMAELDLDEVDLAAVARLAIDLVRTTADQDEVRIDLAAGAIPCIRADRRRLGQVLLNLLENAVKFTPLGGSVGVDLRCRDTDTVVCTVWDTGIGLDSRDHQRVFEPFVQVDSGFDRRYVGSGLGLTLADRFVRLHGGTIELTSSLGAGSRFSVILPVAGPA